MPYLILAALILPAAYIGALVLEARRGTRFFEHQRGEFDRIIANGAFILAHVDLVRFVREEAIHASRRLTHYALHGALQGVRGVERLLTQVVRHLRLHAEAGQPAGESARTFVRTLSEFKGQLESSRPEMPDIR